MNLSALTAAPPVIQAHANAPLAALALGGLQSAPPKGVLPHRALGWVWAALMLGVAATSLFISVRPALAPFGPIHILSFFVRVNAPFAVWRARSGRARAFTLAPGRIMNKVVFG